MPLEYVGFIEKWGRNLIFRPTLHMTWSGKRCVEMVDVYYEKTGYHPVDSPGNTASAGFYGTAKVKGHSKYIRAWIYNLFGFPAYRCQVFLDRILFNGKILEEEERSPLHWTDYKVTYEYPKSMRWRRRNGWYIDIWAADSIDPRLQIISLKGTRGYHRFHKSGIYTIELSAEANKPCSFGHLSLTVQHDGNNWQNLTVLSAKEGGKCFGRFW